MAERRCPRCGALNTADAEWCGQCFTSLREPEPTPRPAMTPAGALAPAAGTEGPAGGVAAGAPAWPCAVCGAQNPIEADACETCGSPFAETMRGAERREAVDPQIAFRRSLVFPGLGHRLVGRSADGFARSVLFLVALLMAVLTGASDRTVLTGLLFVVFALTAVAVYVGAAIEARQLAEGGPLLVSSRVLMWVLVGLVFAAVVLLGVSVVTALRG
jgi:ribosomal protein L40E